MSVRCLWRHLDSRIAQAGVKVGVHRSYSSQRPLLAETARSQLSTSLATRFNRFQGSLLFAGEKWHDLTGYSDIKKLKKQIEEQEQEVTTCVQRMKEAKQAYSEAIRTRSEGQKEHNELLQRKNFWTSSDLERFTTLIRSDHTNSRNEEECERAVELCEEKLEQARARLDNMRSTRYNEEQIWSDNMRGISSLGLMVFNILIFIVVQLGLEPWKRERLVGSFEDKVRKVVLESQESEKLEETQHRQQRHEQTFLTDADYAAETFNHDHAIRRDHSSEPRATQIEPAPSDDVFLTDADHANQAFDHQKQGLAVTTRADDLPDQPGPQHDIYDEAHEGMSPILSLLPSRRALTRSLHSLPSDIATIGRGISARVIRLYSRLLSSQRSALRVEDVTSACFASGVLGVLLGLSLGRLA